MNSNDAMKWTAQMAQLVQEVEEYGPDELKEQTDQYEGEEFCALAYFGLGMASQQGDNMQLAMCCVCASVRVAYYMGRRDAGESVPAGVEVCKNCGKDPTFNSSIWGSTLDNALRGGMSDQA